MYPNLFSREFGRMLLAKFKYRDRATIIGDILDTIYKDPNGKTKTSIMRSANLNLDQANKYLRFLILCDMVKTIDPLGTQEIGRYKLTGKGVNLLRNFDMWQLILETFRQKVV